MYWSQFLDARKIKADATENSLPLLLLLLLLSITIVMTIFLSMHYVPGIASVIMYV